MSGINLPGGATEVAGVLQGALECYAYLPYFLLERGRSLLFCVMLQGPLPSPGWGQEQCSTDRYCWLGWHGGFSTYFQFYFLISRLGIEK